jgi:hypothetical protein
MATIRRSETMRLDGHVGDRDSGETGETGSGAVGGEVQLGTPARLLADGRWSSLAGSGDAMVK